MLVQACFFLRRHRRIILGVALAIFTAIGCTDQSNDVPVKSSVPYDEAAVVAQRQGIDYSETFKKATSGDVEAIKTMLRLSDHMDAGGAIAHGISLVDLAVALGDKRFAAVAAGETEARRHTLALLFEAGFSYHKNYRTGVFQSVLPETYRALHAEQQ